MSLDRGRTEAPGVESASDGPVDPSTVEDADRSAESGAERDRSTPDTPLERCCSRRTVLAAAVGTAAVTAPVTGTAGSAGTGATLHVNVYSGPTPLYARLRDGLGGVSSDWTSAHAAALAAVADALLQVETHATGTGRDWIDVAVDRAGTIGSALTASSPLDALAPAERVYDRFRSAVAERGADADVCCHLLLWWGPFDYRIGYGRTLPGDGQVGLGDRPAGLAVANAGATEGWDGRAVTRNMAIHETLHTYLSPADVDAVIGSRCDHDLGAVTEPEPGVRAVSPMATAYSGTGSGRPRQGDAIGRVIDGLTGSTDGGTRWNGRGCVDDRSLVGRTTTGDGTRWRHTTTLSEETKEAVCRYVERNLG